MGVVKPVQSGTAETEKTVYRASRVAATLVALLTLPLLLGAGAPFNVDDISDPLTEPLLSILGSDGHTGTSGVTGQVWGEPACRKSTPPCMAPARTLEAHVRLVHVGSGKVVRERETDASGEFRISAPPGRYVVEAVPKEGGTCDPVPVEVRPHRYAEVVVSCTI